MNEDLYKIERENEELDSLVRLAQSGDGAAYTALITGLRDLLFTLAFARCKDFHLAQDAVQEAFLEGHRSLASLRRPASAAAWFRVLTLRQTDRLMRGRGQLSNAETTEQPHANGASPAELLERAERRREILQALRDLPEAQRLTLLLFHWHDFSLEQIAGFTQSPLTTVKKRLSDARRKLKKRLVPALENELKPGNARHEARRLSEVIQLLQAIAKWEAETVKRLLHSRPALARTVTYDNDPRGQSLLQRAIPGDGQPETEAQLAVLRLLLEHGADANAPDWNGRPNPPLMRAAWGGGVKTIELLLHYGADPEIGAPDGVWWWRENYRPLDCAAIHSHGAAAEALIAGGAKATIADTVMAGLVDASREMLDENPNLIHEIQAGQSPLHHAVSWHFHPETLELLLTRGANPDSLNHYGYTAPQWALNRGQSTAMISRLQKKGVPPDVFIAAGLPDLEQLRTQLAAEPALATSTLADGTTPLFFAVNAGSLEAVELLLYHGADPNAPGTNEWQGRQDQGTPLRLAARRGLTQITRALLRGGAQPDGQAIANAVWAEGELLRALLDVDLSQINFQDPELGFSAMDWAILRGRTEMAALLLEYGFDPNLQGPITAQYSHAPLHFAAKFNRRAIAELLISRGADLRALDRLHQTPTEIALAAGHTQIAEFLDGV